MICPIMSKPVIDNSGDYPVLENFREIDCLKEKCAWWYKNEDCCSVTLIAGNSMK